MRNAFFLVVLLSAALARLPAAAQLMPVDGVVGVSPARGGSCLAVELQLAEGEGLRGIRWFNNDGTRAFAKVAIAAGHLGRPAALSGVELAVRDVAGGSSAWSEVMLPTAVVSPTGVVTVAFVLPEGGERTGAGAGGGPGMGYVRGTTGLPAFISGDGLEWTQVHPDYRLAVEAMIGPAPLDAVVLATGGMRSASAGTPVSEIVQQGQPRTALLAPYPNPFNPITDISFTLAEPALVDLAIYNLRGQRVLTLLQQNLQPGVHNVPWRGDDDTGAAVASGAYVARLEVGGAGVFTQRLAIVR